MTKNCLKKTVMTMQGHLSHVTWRSKNLDKLMADRNKYPAITDHDIETFKELIVDFKTNFKRMVDKWKVLEFEDFELDGEHDQCESIFIGAEDISDKIIASMSKFIHWFRPPTPIQAQPIQSASGQTTTSATPVYTGPPRTNDMLKPKKLLEEEMSLEAALHWFRTYKNHLDLNKIMLCQQTPRVRRGLLENDIDPHLANALRAHPDVQDDTQIDGENGCLDILKNILWRSIILGFDEKPGLNNFRRTMNP